MAWRIGNAAIESLQGDITRQSDIDAVVNAANAELHTGGGVAGAIHRAAGPGLDDECRAYAPISPGEAVITGAHELPNRHVIHCLGPVYGRDRPEAQLLADCYRNALDRAAETGLSSVAFPAISTGAFGYPFADAAEVALDAVGEWLRAHPGRSLRLLRFVLYSADDQERFAEQLTRRAAAP